MGYERDPINPVMDQKEYKPPFSNDPMTMMAREWEQLIKKLILELDRLRQLLREVHEILDDVAPQVGYTLCRWCKAKNYHPEVGVEHHSTCILVRLREVLH